MKFLFSIAILCFFNQAIAQSIIPNFLSGTWKREGKSNFEHWDILSKNTMKGFSYKKDSDGNMLVQEYLSIRSIANEIEFEASVLDQNEGKPIVFQGELDSNILLVSNAEHDFPKNISYKKLDSNQILVTVGGTEKQFTYKLIRVNKESNKSEYNEELAKSLNADEYGMKSYFFVVLKTGSNQTKDKEAINLAFKGHMDNINRLAKEKKLIVAGPFGKNDDQIRGLFILDNIKSIEDAKSVLETDPAIKSGFLSYQIYPWYGSAALPMYLPYSEQISKQKP